MRYCFMLAVLLAATPALAEDISSAYTPFDLDKCKVVEPPDGTIFEGTWSCKGYGGYSIIWTGADARTYVSFTKGGGDTCAAHQGFGAFNTALSPVEWRVAGGKPFAAIERWSLTDAEYKQSTWLVVTALKETDSCHAAYVAGNFPDANAEARKAADSYARNFDCADGIVKIVSKGGEAPLMKGPTCREIDGLNYE